MAVAAEPPQSVAGKADETSRRPLRRRLAAIIWLGAIVAVATVVVVSPWQTRQGSNVISQMSTRISAHALDAGPQIVAPRLLLNAARADEEAVIPSAAKVRAVAVWPLFAVGIAAGLSIFLIARHHIRRTTSRITAMGRQARDLEDRVETFEQTDAERARFIANVSQDLRAPLTAVLGFAQIAQTRLETVIFPSLPDHDPRIGRAVGQVRENIGILIAEGQRLTKIIDDILDLDRIEAGRMAWDIEPLDMGSLIRQAAAATRALYAAKGLAFQMDIDDDLPPVRGDRDRLVQVLTNLISNAVMFTERGHVACVARRDVDSFVSVAISDTGIGIAPADQPGLFDRFRQTGDIQRATPSGMGLGLPICRGITERLGGTITVESAPGHGSTFTVRLPLSGNHDTGVGTDRTGDAR